MTFRYKDVTIKAITVFIILTISSFAIYANNDIIRKQRKTLHTHHQTYLKILKKFNTTSPNKKEALDASGKVLQYAYFVLHSNIFKPSVKYPKALRLYKFALKYNKNSTDAMENIKLIEGIYKSMNKKIPE